MTGLMKRKHGVCSEKCDLRPVVSTKWSAIEIRCNRLSNRGKVLFNCHSPAQPYPETTDQRSAITVRTVRDFFKIAFFWWQIESTQNCRNGWNVNTKDKYWLLSKNGRSATHAALSLSVTASGAQDTADGQLCWGLWVCERCHCQMQPISVTECSCSACEPHACMWTFFNSMPRDSSPQLSVCRAYMSLTPRQGDCPNGPKRSRLRWLHQMQPFLQPKLQIRRLRIAMYGTSTQPVPLLLNIWMNVPMTCVLA
jgi:hypothetical protein